MTTDRVVARAMLVLCLVLPAVSAAALESAWVITTDYSTFGRIRSFDPNPTWSVSGDLATIPGDAVGRHHDDRIYIVGRGAANLIQIYDPSSGFDLVREFSLGENLNPQDIAFDSEGDAYVSCYDQAVLLKVDLETETVLDSIDTAQFADADGLPETGWMLAVDDRLYVTSQLLDRDYYYSPSGPGRILVYDMIGERWLDQDPTAPGVQGIVLTGSNPYTRLEFVAGVAGGSRLRVGCAGYFGLNDGGLELVDTAGGISLGFEATEAELGGDVIGFAATGTQTVHVLVSDATFTTSMRCLDLDSGAVEVWDTGSGYVHADVAWDGGAQLYLADRTPGASGLRVFDLATGGELTTDSRDTGLPPLMFVLPARDTGAPISGVVPAAAAVRLGAAWPNPCNPRARLELQAGPNEPLMISVFDLRGRRRLTCSIVTDAAGNTAFDFQGRDDAGRALPAGGYLVRAKGRTGEASARLTLVK